MGYQESDIIFFYAVIAALILFWVFRKKSPDARPPDGAPSRGNPAMEGMREKQTPSETREPAGGIQSDRQAGASPVKGILVVLTSGDPTTQFMALTLATLVAGKGKSVRVLLCGAGGDLGRMDGKEVMLKGINKSPRMLLKGLIQSGAVVEICPPYLAHNGIGAMDLMEGVKPAVPPAVAEGMLDPGIRLFTL